MDVGALDWESRLDSGPPGDLGSLFGLFVPWCSGTLLAGPTVQNQAADTGLPTLSQCFPLPHRICASPCSFRFVSSEVLVTWARGGRQKWGSQEAPNSMGLTELRAVTIILTTLGSVCQRSAGKEGSDCSGPGNLPQMQQTVCIKSSRTCR